MSQSSQSLLLSIERIRRRLWRRFYAEGLLRFLVALFAAFLAALLLGLAGAPALVGGALFWLIVLAAGGYLIAKYVVFPRRVYRSPYAVAAWTETRQPHFKHRLASAAQFATQEPGTRHYSVELAEAAMNEVLEPLQRLDITSLFPKKELKPTAIRLSVLLAVCAALLVVFPSAGWRALYGLAGINGADDDATKPNFLAGDLDLTYLYPPYTGLQPMEIKNASGAIETYPGTEIVMSVRTRDDFDSGRLDMDDGPDVPLSRTGERRFEGRFTVIAEDRYRFRFENERDSRSHAISLKTDRVPVVVIQYPPNELDVRDTDRIELAYRAEDDFGLGALTLVVNHDTGKGRIDTRLTVKSPEGNPKAIENTWLWDLAGLRLMAGDRVSYYLEALDNDSVGGPKIGRSATHTLKVFSVHEHHQKLIQRQEEIWEAMLALLAKYLENPINESTIPSLDALLKTLSDSVLELVESLIKPVAALNTELADDPLASDAVRDMFATIHDDFRAHSEEYASLHNRVASAPPANTDARGELYLLMRLRQGSVERLERYIMDLYELLQKQKYDALVAESERLADMRDELRQMLEAYKNSGDEALKKQLMERLKEFREKMNELMKKMAELTKEIPEEFVNKEALDTSEMNNDLSSLEEMLEKGDLEAALEQMELLSKQLNDMLDGMKEGSEKLGESLYSESMQKLMNFQKDLDQLLAEEQQLHSRTQAQYDEYRKKMNEALKKQLDEKMAALSEKAKQALKEIEAIDNAGYELPERYREQAKARVADLQKALDAADLDGALDIGHLAREHTRSLAKLLSGYMPGQSPEMQKENIGHADKGFELTDEIVEQLNRLMPDPEKLLSPEQRQMLQQMARRQMELGREAERMRREMQQMGEEMPFMPSDAGEQMEQAGMGMQQSRQELQQMRPGEAEGHQQQAINSLQQVKSGLQQALKQMQSSMKFGGLKPGMRRDGGRDHRGEKVAIPQAEDYKAPKALREDLLEAMKRKSPESYKPQTRQYYKELVK